ERMLAALIIVFREVLEAGLIVGVVLAASRGVAGRGRAVALGILAGVAGSVVVALFATQISAAFDGRGLELFTAAVLALAVVMLTWHVVWMADHARDLTRQMRTLGHDVESGAQSVAVLGVATATAVMREGSEVVLFLSGIALQNSDGWVALALGSAGGLALGAAASAILYFGLAAIPLRAVFSTTGILVMLLAAGLAAGAVHQLSNAGLIAPAFDAQLWDTSWILSEQGMVGRVLHVLIGYRDRPTVGEGIAYAATIAGIFALSKLQNTYKRPALSS
ncbi:MAG TPA: FTR1 family protein, partial [Hyphomicrobium sp.]|nr:FTR1 family protein [Hyphomicrobium sp.]